ncbi:twin-arginine translocase TatA/TatE family subunit [Streptomyces antibioticus]|uniref:twin-arginine translocase TatA/TatE family subunit n=1 Tax=Streptomyces antibioticus TaxID=1890 RepID=UPI0033A3C0A3
MFGLSEVAVVLVVIAVVVGVRKLPGLVRSAGASARILKAEARADGTPVDDNGGGPGAPRVVRGETVPPGDAPGDETR